MAKNPILGMFGRSPIRPLQEHMATVDECVGLLIPFFEAVMASDYTQAAVLQESIARRKTTPTNKKMHCGCTYHARCSYLWSVATC